MADNPRRRSSDQWTVLRMLTACGIAIGVASPLVAIGISIGLARAADQRSQETHVDVQANVKPAISKLQAFQAAQTQINEALGTRLDEFKGDLTKDLDELKAMMREVRQDIRSRP